MRIIQFIGELVLITLVKITIMVLAGYGAYITNIINDMGNVLR